MALDFTVARHLLFALGPELVLLAGAMILLVWAAWRPDSAAHQRAVGIASIVLTIVTMAAVIWYLRRGDLTMTAEAVAVDAFRWLADIILLLGTALTIAIAIDFNEREGLGAAESHVLVLLAASGMMLLAGARDLILVFLGIELVSVCSYALSAMNRRSVRGAEGALKYFLLGAFATGFLLYGIAL